MTDLYADIFTEPEDVDPAALADLGSYFEATVLMVQGQPEPLSHQDRNTVTRISEPTPNPLTRKLATA